MLLGTAKTGQERSKRGIVGMGGMTGMFSWFQGGGAKLLDRALQGDGTALDCSSARNGLSWGRSFPQFHPLIPSSDP